MRPRCSIAGPLVLIAIGVLFLVHTFTPDFRVGAFLAANWPYLLIIWGVVQLLEIAFSAVRFQTPAPASMGAGSWFLIAMLCVAGFAIHELAGPNQWWNPGFFPYTGFLGSEHDFSIAPIQRVVGDAPHIVIEAFRGDAKVMAGDNPNLTVTGHKVVRAMDDASAAQDDARTPVEVLLQGKTVVIRCNQGRIGGRPSVSTNLEIDVPRGASLEVTGKAGDFDVSGLNGDVDVTSGRARVRVDHVQGNLHIDTGKSDEIRCAAIGGSVTLRGHGNDVGLSDIAGEVDVNGNYSGLISLAHIAKHVRLASMRTEFEAARIPGEVKLARGSVDGNGLTGPLKVAARVTDVSLGNFTDNLDLSVDRGDVELRPGHVPLSNVSVRAGAGDIDLALPVAAGVTVAADTERGVIENDLGFSSESNGHSAHLEGSSGKGAQITLSTRRGDIRVHHAAKPTAQIAESKNADDDQ